MELSKEILDEYYTKENKTLVEIAKETGWSPSTILIKMVKFGIPRRRWGGDRSRRQGIVELVQQIDESILRRLYISERRSVHEIVKLFGANRTKITCQLKELGVYESRGGGRRKRPPETPQSFENRFLAKVEKTESCWIWVGSKTYGGYGLLMCGDKSKLAHRLSWELHSHKMIPTNMLVLHSCDNPSCVNPQHLFLGTPKDNIQDAIQKGRYRNKLPKETRENILSVIKSGTYSRDKLAEMFGVNQSTISNYIRRSDGQKAV